MGSSRFSSQHIYSALAGPSARVSSETAPAVVTVTKDDAMRFTSFAPQKNTLKAEN